jgi:hypothetical protein
MLTQKFTSIGKLEDKKNESIEKAKEDSDSSDAETQVN